MEDDDPEANSDEQNENGEESDSSDSNSLNYQKLCSGEELTGVDDDEEGMAQGKSEEDEETEEEVENSDALFSESDED